MQLNILSSNQLLQTELNQILNINRETVKCQVFASYLKNNWLTPVSVSIKYLLLVPEIPNSMQYK